MKPKNRKQKVLIDSINDIIFKTDHQGYFTYINSVSEKITEYSNEELIGMNFIELIPESHKKSVAEFFERQFKERSDQSYFEFPIVTKSGKQIWLGQNCQTIFENNLITEFIAVARDISERRAAEQKLITTSSRLTALIQNMQAGILVESANGKIVLMNDFLFELFGIQGDPNSHSGQDRRHIVQQIAKSVIDPENFQKNIERLAALHQHQIDDEIELKDGRILQRDFVPIYNQDNYLGQLWQYRDITRKKESENQLIKSKRIAEKAEADQKQFLTNMSHEIRTPLNAVIGLTHLLYDTSPTKKQVEYLDSIKQSSDHLLRLISDILDLSKIEAGELELAKEPFDLHYLLLSIQKSFEYAGKNDLVELKLTIDDKLPNIVKGDKTALQQILVNLIGNAFKFTSSGTIDLRASLRSGKDDTVTVDFAVRDTGIGITEEELPLIFQKFKQSNVNSANNYGGSGLGLAICKSLVEMQNGQISATSAPGSGSTFEFFIDLEKTENKEIIEDTIEAKNKKETKDPSESRILVVEDNLMNQQYVGDLLSSWEIDFSLANNGSHALSFIDKNVYDLILMDVRMPVMDGYETTVQIRSKRSNPNSNIPIIGLTASALMNDRLEALKIGMDDHITKPFTPKKLQAVLGKYIDLSDVNSGSQKFSWQVQQGSDDQINKEVLSDLYAGDREHMAHMFELFIRSNRENMEQISNYYGQNDIKMLYEISHKIKPTFAMVGLMDVHDLTSEIESICKSGEGIEKLKTLIPDLLNMNSQAVAAVKEELKKIK